MKKRLKTTADGIFPSFLDKNQQTDGKNWWKNWIKKHSWNGSYIFHFHPLTMYVQFFKSEFI